MAQRNRKNSIIIYRKKRQENNEMNDLDKVYAESVAKEYMPRETNKVRQLKKLDERGLPWVNDTKSSVKRINQKAEGEDVMPVLILGYQLNQIEHISQVTLSYMEGDQHLWAPIDLGDMAATNQIAAMTVPATEEPVVGVKPGKQRDKEKAAL